jgi:NAD(P)-dependent dehydrogenase (short-subunit alcohol dehydrogenase family)
MPKTIFISGGSKGIGLAIARIFHAQDFQVIICARGKAGLEAAAAALPGIDTYRCDISDKAAVYQLAHILNEKYGALDVLVNNGGTFLPGLIHEEDDSVFEQLIATNLNSAYYFTKALLPPMREKRRGTIFNMCSVASIQPYPNGGSYCISKFALLGFSKMLREEMKPYNIRVISILPGAVRTDSWDGVDLPDERFIPPEDIGKLVWNAYEMSDRTVVEEILVRPTPGDI